MRPKSMILILIALGCGLIASIGISQVVERGSNDEAEAVKTSPIYVAVTDIGVAEELNAQRVKLEEWPIDRIPPGAVTTAEQIEGMAPNQRLFAGEPILLGKLANQDSLTSAASRVKPGHRVISVKVTMESSVSHLIQPGDHVDIMAFIRGNGRNLAPKAEVILADIEVFAINDQIIRQPDQDGGTIAAKTVSLQVTPDQATKLVFFSSQGQLSLSLRSPEDENKKNRDQYDYDPTPGLAPAPAPQPLAVVSDNGFKMQILDGTGAARVFKFNEDGELPQLVTGGMSGTGSVATTTPLPPFTPGAGVETPTETSDTTQIDQPMPAGDGAEASETQKLNFGELNF